MTGSEDCRQIDEGQSSFVEGVEQLRLERWSCNLTMSDPRIDRTWGATINKDCQSGRCVYWGTQELHGSEGGGACSFTGRSDPTGTAEALVLLVCPGRGANAGWTYITYNLFGPGGDFDSGGRYDGLIYKGASPQWGPLPS